jgi:hypothetical protein
VGFSADQPRKCQMMTKMRPYDVSFQQLQNQQQRRLQLLQKRREEKARHASMETSSNGSGPAFGIADDLDLKVLFYFNFLVSFRLYIMSEVQHIPSVIKAQFTTTGA